MYDDIVTLIQIQNKPDEYGDMITVQTEREVFAQIMSVGQKEFYQANALGLKPEKKFKLSDYDDYQNEKLLRHDGKVYRILRTYKNEKNEIEIIVHEGVKNVSSKIGN